MKKQSPANVLTKYVILRCNSLGMYVWRNNTTGIFDPSSKRFRKGTHRGVGDVIGTTKDGVHIEFEVKIGKDVQNIFQVAHQKNVEKRNGFYFVVRTIEDFELVIKKALKRGLG